MNPNRNPPTERQRDVLLKILPDTPVEEIDRMSFHDASRVIAWNAAHWRGYPATQKQEVFLRNRGRWRDGIGRGEAFDLIAEIKRQEEA